MICVISGIGIYARNGETPAHVWGTPNDSEAPQVKGSKALTPRDVRKIDAFSVASYVTAMGALEHAGVDLQLAGPERVGMIIGNNTGGWQYVEPQLRAMHAEGFNNARPIRGDRLVSRSSSRRDIHAGCHQRLFENGLRGALGGRRSAATCHASHRPQSRRYHWW